MSSAPEDNEKGTLPPEVRWQEPTLMQEILGLFLKIIGIAFVVVLLFIFMFGLYYASDAGMQPAVKGGDLVFFYRLDKDYTASDVIVLEYNDQLEVRRVIAVAGDTVDITANGLMVNGALQDEQEIYVETAQFTGGVTFPLTVPAGQVFVLGDNRENATDSRIYGCVDIKKSYGQVAMILRRRGI